MTAQVPDKCTYDGRKWAIISWNGNYSTIPTNELLGIRTNSTSTANWSGRIDHFMVSRNRLYLLKIEVNLSDDSRLVLPKGAQREVLCRYENMLVWDEHGSREEVKEHRFEYLVFHDLPVPYTGDLHLSYPCVDYWDQPYNADEDDEDQLELMLSFDAGVLVRAEQL
jgi:hypothetical protein